MPVTAMIDARLAEGETDGWRYADMPEDGQAWRDTLAYLDADAQVKYAAAFAECPAADQRALIQAVQDLGSGDWHGLPASPGLEPVDPLRVHRVLRPPVGLERDGLPGARPIRAATRTRAWDGGSRSRWRTSAPPRIRCGRANEYPGPSAQRICLAAAQRRHPDEPSAAPGHAAVRRHRRDRPGHRGLRGGRVRAAAAAGPGGLAGRRAGRRAVLGPGHRLVQRRGRVPSPVLDRAPGDHRRRPGAARLEQLRPRRGRLHGPLRRLHPALPSQRLRDPDPGRGGRRLAAQLRRPQAVLHGDRGGTAGRRGRLALGRPARLSAPAASGRRERRGVPARGPAAGHYGQGRTSCHP